MFAYRQVDAQLLMHHYVSNGKFLIRNDAQLYLHHYMWNGKCMIRNELSLDRFVVCAFCDEERSVTKDMLLFIKEWGQSAGPGQYFYQERRDSEYVNGLKYLEKAKMCLDHVSLSQ